MNNVTLVGTLVEEPELKEFDNGLKGAFIVLKVVRPFKSMDGNYEADFIRCSLWEGIAQNTCEYCHKGDIIGIRGRISVRSDEILFNCDKEQHVKKINALHIIVERVSFISASRKNKEISLAYQDAI